jgi:hypothetical protein
LTQINTGAPGAPRMQIMRKTKAKQIYLEVSTHPERLDLIDCRVANDEGVLIDVLNARSLRDLMPLLRRPGAVTRYAESRAPVAG